MMIDMCKHQKECINEIIIRMDEGQKHFSVVMTVGLGLTYTALFLSKEMLHKHDNSILFVFRYRAECEQAIELSNRIGISDKIKCVTYSEYIHRDQESFGVLFLFDLSIAERKNMYCLNNLVDITTVSFFRFNQSCNENDGFSSTDNHNPLVCVYATQGIIDIRDISVTSEKEYDFVKKEISVKEELIQKLEANHQDVGNDSTQATEIEQLKAFNAYLMSILQGFGVSNKVVLESFNQLQKLRKELQEQLDSSDEDVKEQALKILQDKTSEYLTQIIQSTPKDVSYYEELLKGDLSTSVWNKLAKKSRSFLITAKYTYDSMIKMPDKDTLDYSGVCLLVTKALEVECARRFYTSYKEYLNKKYQSPANWPALTKDKKVISENKFMLGSVAPTMGYKVDFDGDDNMIISTGYKKAKDVFKAYASNYLFNFWNEKRCENEIYSIVEFVERVRVDYRNPSAHKDELNIISAENCLNYVIGIHHMLKNMLEIMKK